VTRAGRAGLASFVLAAAVSVAGERDTNAQQPGPSPRFAQPPPVMRRDERTQPPIVVATPLGGTRELRAHFGVDIAARLVRSSDEDERLRGLERAAELGSPQALALLGAALDTQTGAIGAARLDPRALVCVARGLARATDQTNVRGWLGQILTTGAQTRGLSREGDDPDGPPRIELAREIAALALASSDDPRGGEALLPIARGVGPGHDAATAALAAFPPRAAALGLANPTPAGLRLAALLGDLRSVDAVRAALKASEPAVRAAALVATGELGDLRSLDLVRAALGEHDARIRAAAAEALVLLGAADAPRAVEGLLADDATALAGVRLAERAQDSQVSKALAARVVASQNEAIRTAGVAALGRGANADATRALVALLAYPELAGDAANALGRSPSATAMAALEAAAGAPATRRLAVRAYVVRAHVRGERSRALDAVIADLWRATEPVSRALGAFARVALGEARAVDLLGDKEPRVRRAAAMATLAAPTREALDALVRQGTAETDEATRAVMDIGLLGGDADGRLTTTALLDRAESGGPGAPLAATALAQRTEDAPDPKVLALLRARDPLLRAHAARGLGASRAPSTAGYLAEAWAYEPNLAVRRALVLALAARTGDTASPSRARTLTLAARLDPDARVRWSAARALEGRPAELRRAPSPEVAWLRVADAAGAAPGGVPFTGALVLADGVAVPIAFDDDGYALVLGVPPGEARLVLAPRVPKSEDPKR
jgi:hypothetical protein